MLCQRQIKQAIGHWWTIFHSSGGEETQLWAHRKKLLSQLALRMGGNVRTTDVAKCFGIPTRSARDWLYRMEREDVMEAVKHDKKTVSYRLKGYGDRK